MSQNSSSHYQKLRSVLQQELQRAPAPVSPALPMKKFIPWLVAAPLAVGSLAAVMLWQQPHTTNSTNNTHLSLVDFISAAEAATTTPVSGVLHQKFHETYIDPVTGTTERHFLETWHGDHNYADQQLSEDGATVLEQYTEVYDVASNQQRGYELHAKDPITDPIISDNQLDSDATVCGINSADFPDLSFDAQVAELARITTEAQSTEERISLLRTMVDQGKVVDLGVQEGQRGLEIQAHQQTFQYWFDPATYALESYKQLDAHGQVRSQLDYVVDEYLAVDEMTLPIFTELSGLTEIHLYPDASSLGADFFNTHPTGCYNAQGELVDQVEVSTQVDENGDVTITYTSDDLAADANADSN